MIFALFLKNRYFNVVKNVGWHVINQKFSMYFEAQRSFNLNFVLQQKRYFDYLVIKIKSVSSQCIRRIFTIRVTKSYCAHATWGLINWRKLENRKNSYQLTGIYGWVAEQLFLGSYLFRIAFSGESCYKIFVKNHFTILSLFKHT